MGNETRMDKDDKEKDIAEDADDGDARVDPAIEHFVDELVNFRMTVVTRNVHHHFYFLKNIFSKLYFEHNE